MKPFVRHYNNSKQQVKEDFLLALKKQKITVLGENDRLGLISFEEGDKMFYAHFSETSNSTTELAIAPGLSYLKDREPAELPDKIRHLMNKIEGSDKRR